MFNEGEPQILGHKWWILSKYQEDDSQGTSVIIALSSREFGKLKPHNYMWIGKLWLAQKHEECFLHWRWRSPWFWLWSRIKLVRTNNHKRLSYDIFTLLSRHTKYASYFIIFGQVDTGCFQWNATNERNIVMPCLREGVVYNITGWVCLNNCIYHTGIQLVQWHYMTPRSYLLNSFTLNKWLMHN